MKIEDAKGSWALITGASTGIGREFAIQLAQSGLNIVLVARRRLLLESLAEELSQKYGVCTLPLPFDLSDPKSYTDIQDRLIAEQIKIRLLVNNAAFGYWGHFTSASAEKYADMIHLNILALIAMCHHFSEDLASFPSSVIINVASQAAYNPIPYMATYAASKAFVASFSQALYGEWAKRGILVQTLVPGPTETEFDLQAGAPSFADKNRISADAVVTTSLAHLARNSPVVTRAKGLFKQRLFAAIAPARVVINTVGNMFRPPTS